MPLHTAYNLENLFMQRRKTTARAENPKKLQRRKCNVPRGKTC